MAVFHADTADMKLSGYLPMTTDPKDIPLNYQIGDTVYHGIPSAFSPKVRRTSVDSNLTQFTFTGTSPEGITVSAEVLCYRDFPVTEWIAYFSNETDKKSPIVSDIRLCAGFTGNDPVLCHANGDTCTEDGYEIFRDAVTEEITLASADGLPNVQAFPYLRICMDDRFFSLAVGWSGGWCASFTPFDGGVHMTVGQRRCHMTILPGETMRTPRVTFMAAGENEDHARNLWRKWYFAHILPKENGSPIPPKLCMHVFGVDGEEFTGATTKTQCEGMQAYIDGGVKPDIWWMDAGWYPCDHKWYTTVGTWHCDEARFPNGMGEIGRKCEENGIQFLVWFEPERVRADTELYRTHPEWLLSADGSENYLLDLGNQAALSWLIETVNARIDEYHIHIYRQDFNFSPLPYWEKNETEDRIGAMENLHVQGYLAYWDSLIDRHPGLWIDSCAGGGRRNDLDTMRRAVTLHYTDIGYGNHPIKQKQHRLMFEWIPYFRAHNMSWDNPDGTYGQDQHGGDHFSFHCALAPALTDMLFYRDSEQNYQNSREMIPIWRRAAEVELRGDYYPLTVCRKNPQDFYAMQFDDPEKGDGFVQIIRNTQVTEDTFVLYMKAVREDARYFFENPETGDVMTLSGVQLAAGIPLTLPPRSGAVWFYHTDKTE